MDSSVQIAFRIDKTSRDMARCFNINISDVCRKAIQDEIGLKLQTGFSFDESKAVAKTRKKALEDYIKLLEYQKEQQEKLMNNITIIKDNIKRQNAAEIEKEQLLDRIIKILDKSFANLGGLSYLRDNLPEFDNLNHYARYKHTQKLVKQLSKLMNREITDDIMFQAIRKGLK